jgi:5'(3')-deoxyribonucleotidase
MDGVIADFLNPAAQAVGLDLSLVEKGNWDVFKQAGCNLKDVWAKIDNYEFWANLPVIPGAKEFVAQVQEHYLSVTILTSSSWSSDCPKGKMDWLRKHFGHGTKALVGYGGASKAVCAKPGNLLIDDCDRNIDAFEAAGGEVLTVPRPWNRMHLGGDLEGTSYTHVNYNYLLSKLGIAVRLPSAGFEESLV